MLLLNVNCNMYRSYYAKGIAIETFIARINLL